MKTVGAFDAKTHFSALLAEVEKGERIIITKHGTPAARLEPVDSSAPAKPEETIREILRLAAKNKLDGLSLKTLIEEGRE